jgi:XapX domain-containing protein
MNGYLMSLLVGLFVDVVYGLVQVPSLAPPLMALVGLLGMVFGAQAADLARHHFVRPTQISTRHLPDDAREFGWRRASYATNKKTTIIQQTDLDQGEGL